MTDWSREPWVKLFTRDAGAYLCLSLSARGLYHCLQRVTARDGTIDLGGMGVTALAALLRAKEADVEAPLAELVRFRMVVENPSGPGLLLPEHAEQQGSRTAPSVRQRQYRERNAASHGVTQSNAEQRLVTDRDDRSDRKNRSDKKEREITRAREDMDPKAAELAADLAANPVFSRLNTSRVAEALIGHLGVAALNVTGSHWRPAIAEAALQAETGATEGRLRQLLAWRFADLRDGKRRTVKRPQGAGPDLASEVRRIDAARRASTVEDKGADL